MAEIINLRRARKAKVRAEAAAEADANRRKFGRPKAERDQAEAAAELAAKRLDGHRLGKPGSDDA